MFPTILIVDDEASIVQSMKGLLADEGFDVLTASNGYEALQMIDNESPDLILLDIWMPGIDGLETLKEIKTSNPFIQVIIITGHGNVETAVKATKLGAFDLIEKPISFDKIIVAINNALNFRRLEEENRFLRKKTLEKHSIDGHSGPIQALKQKIAAVAPKDSWVLIYGENGTGKELVARTIYQLSPRVDKSFVDVNCAAIPEALIESNLFGHEKGAFKGATGKKRGTFELANEGTIFLDEISDMSLKTQAKILRVLQEQKFQRVGSGRVLSVDVRVIAATNKNLREEIEKGNFREDLYHRLNVVPIEVPSLRERQEDIPLLVDLFLRECAQQDGESRKTMTGEALDLLTHYHWPGNVRELKNLVEHLVILAPNATITPEDIPAGYHTGMICESALADKYLTINNFKDAKKAFERLYIRSKLAGNKGNITRTAMQIGVGRSYLHKKLKQLDL
ncbi:MAG: sigma-54 dependent transcriptional regulator [Desulfobacterales bacterium]|nr:sigma-54 dependent transcriptional regulator [Desulfobacterales bacterium]MDJ0854778.1 sigma-54 dependent transcriptional regulator [Desulfobacterales bacterium]MDJ0888536.1 sigma-54 dependent transcriptional regulator [Desulfobacterales bacterium]MDJ0989379.1 sigma-54 dependent transcriptional regulator [Desulfobacterales bacterium]